MYHYTTTPVKGKFFRASKKTPNELYLQHLRKYYLLTFLSKKSVDANDSIQIANELAICQRKLTFHYSNDGFDVGLCQQQTRELKLEWRGVMPC